MIVLLLITALVPSSFADEVQDAYASNDASALRIMLSEADGRADSLLVRYRLYPLTEDASLVDDLPKSLEQSSARELALLSGLWSYKAGEASIFSAVSYGRRSARLLDQAKEKDSDDPYVLLIEGQSLLFRPAIAGPDPSKAAERFSILVSKVETNPGCGITPTEAKAWKWLALRESGRTEAAAELRNEVMANSPPPLYQEFLREPPDV